MGWLEELLIKLGIPEREEFSSYMYNIYNTLMNREQWSSDLYVPALKNIHKNARALSNSLKKMSTYIRKTIEKLMREVSGGVGGGLLRDKQNTTIPRLYKINAP